MYALGDVSKLADSAPSTVQQSLFAAEKQNLPLYILGAYVVAAFLLPMFSKRRGDW